MRRVVLIKGGPTRDPAAADREAGAASQPVDHRSLGDGHRDARRWSAAAAAYGRHLETAPNDAAIWIQAGNCHKEAGEFARSLAAYRKAAELEPDNPEVHLQLGHFYKVTKQFSASLAAYEKAAVLDPDSGEIRHEIRDLSERIKAAPGTAPLSGDMFASTDDLLDRFRKLPAADDPFASYFRSIGGYAIERGR